MIKRESGFSLIELLMVMLIMGFVLAASSEMFVSLLRGYTQQSKIAETNVEGIIGLELLRRDIESAGYGLPWSLGATSYSESANAPASLYNDSPANPPRAVVSDDNIGTTGYVNGSDYLVIKALNVAGDDVCTKWTYLSGSPPAAPALWNPSNEELGVNDRVIVINPGTPATNSRALVAPVGNLSSAPLLFSGASAYSSSVETRIVYGVNRDTNLIMPFNRADYYVRTLPAADMPQRCAQGTGILYKAVLDHATGNLGAGIPLLDCVADMQVVTYLDTDGDGTKDADSNGLLVPAALTAAKSIRDQLKEIHVYILAHEGQRDASYTHPTSTILVGESSTLGRNFNLAGNITDWQNYRWKIYTLVMKPNNLR